jgi:glycosyltransferase involved in cell wall biosynthesis
LEALRILLDRKIRVTLDIVGDGPERERITSQAQNYGLDSVIKYHGWVGWDKLSDIYSRSNIFVHSSHKEGFGKVLIEAMSYALPIVATDVGVSRTLVDSNRCGIVVKPGKPEAIAGAIAILINDIDAMKEMGHRGRKASMNLLLERQEQFYSSFIQNSLGLNC